MSRETTKATKVITYGGQLYSVRNTGIDKVSFEFEGTKTLLKVEYFGARYPEYAFSVAHENGKPDFKSASELYVSIMALNEQLLREKDTGVLFT